MVGLQIKYHGIEHTAVIQRKIRSRQVSDSEEAAHHRNDDQEEQRGYP